MRRREEHLESVRTLVEEGWSLEFAIRRSGLSKTTFYRWCREYQEWEEIRAMYVESQKDKRKGFHR